MQHEMEVAGAAGALGSIDANTGDMLLGWDTDQFPTDIYLATQCMLTLLNYGGLTTGGVNFDAKVRRESFEPADLFYAHIGGMDAFARGLKIAAAIRKDGRLAEFIRQRYSSWDSGIGREIDSGKSSFAALEKYMLKKGDAGGKRQRPPGIPGELNQRVYLNHSNSQPLSERGSHASRSPSPTKFNASSVSASAAPGKTISHQ